MKAVIEIHVVALRVCVGKRSSGILLSRQFLAAQSKRKEKKCKHSSEERAREWKKRKTNTSNGLKIEFGL